MVHHTASHRTTKALAALSLAVLWAIIAPALWPLVAHAAPPADPSAPQDAAFRPRVWLPLTTSATTCPRASSSRFSVIPVLPPPSDRPAERHADLNLALRGYAASSASPGLMDYNGATDAYPPQMRGLFADGRVPGLVRAYQVYNWDWTCGADGCRAGLLWNPAVTLLGMLTSPGEPIRIASRVPEIYGGGFKALVLYAEERRITLKYTRDDNVVGGYTVHIEDVCVDPNLLASYWQQNALGRRSLPALRNGETLGTAAGRELRVAVRDTGNFMDPRSRKDWWVSAP